MLFSSVTVSGGDCLATIPQSSVETYISTRTTTKIIGVLPEKIEALYPKMEIWVPAVFSPESLSPKYRWYVGYSMLARLAPGVSFRQVQAGIDTSAANFNDGTFARFQVEVRPLTDEEVGDTRTQLYLLLGAVGLLLLIAYANVANLVTVRNEGRSQEIAIPICQAAHRGSFPFDNFQLHDNVVSKLSDKR